MRPCSRTGEIMATSECSIDIGAGSATRVSLEAAAELDNVVMRFGRVLALDRFSLSIYPGEVLALLGANGAGKTTAVSLLLGLRSPQSGTARVFGRDPRKSSSRTRVGAMLQVGGVPGEMTVSEHLRLFRSYYARPMPMDELVEIAGLEKLLKRRFGQLSGGERQRTLFALALAGDPDILFLDEPTVGLDIATRRSLWAQVRALSSRGKAVLLTTHYLEEADALASRIVIINNGRTVRAGTPGEIKALSSLRIVRCKTALPLDALRNMRGVLSASYEPALGQTMLETSEPEVLLRDLLLQDSTLSDFEIITRPLEDAFLALTAPVT